jgi:DNA invertase Pin-like site-specific DNA recombinase
MRAALYARFSTDKQSSTSDQLRVCAALAEREGFTVVHQFTDEALSGGTASRPGYQAMLTAVRAGEVQVIVAEDQSRLWRNMAEQAPRMAELIDLGVFVVTHDNDTRQEMSDWMSAILGTSSQVYRKEIGRRVRRSAEGRARAGKPVGGRAYGYSSTREILPDQAEVVREIFSRFAAGDTLLSIASDLNVRGVPSPGSVWTRKTRRSDGAWMISALHSMLKNDVYTGQIVWNRRTWVRSAVDSSKRRPVMNPPSTWIVHERPDLRLVDEVTWHRVQKRLAERRDFYKPGPGARSQYLLSGLLRCGICGAAYVITAHRPVRYACSSRKHGGDSVCGNRLTLRKDVAEEALIAPVVEQLLSPAAIDLAVKTMQQLAAEAGKPPTPAALEKIDGELAELQRLTAAGVLSQETVGEMRQRLLERRGMLEREIRKSNVSRAVFGAERIYREAVADMREILQGDDVRAAQEVLRDLVGEIPLVPDSTEPVLWAQLAARPLALAAAGGVNWSGSGGLIWSGLQVRLPAGWG